MTRNLRFLIFVRNDELKQVTSHYNACLCACLSRWDGRQATHRQAPQSGIVKLFTRPSKDEGWQYLEDYYRF